MSDLIGYTAIFGLSDPGKLRMISRRTAMSYIVFGTAAIGTLFAGTQGLGAAAGRAASFAAIDADRDGALNLDEVKRAAGDLFDELDANHDGTLTRSELRRRRLSRRAFAAADTDKDGTLSKDEYLALVERLFQAADVDHDGTLSPAEFRSAIALRRLIH